MSKGTFEDAIAWLKQAEGKPPVIASSRTQARHNSEWQPTIIHKNDKEALKRVLQKRKEHIERYTNPPQVDKDNDQQN